MLTRNVVPRAALAAAGFACTSTTFVSRCASTLPLGQTKVLKHFKAKGLAARVPASQPAAKQADHPPGTPAKLTAVAGDLRHTDTVDVFTASTWWDRRSEVDWKSLLKPKDGVDTECFKHLIRGLDVATAEDKKQFAQALLTSVKPLCATHRAARPRIDIEQHLQGRIGNRAFPYTMKLQKRDEVISRLKTAIPPDVASSKINVAYMFSMRGSGKTQLIMYFAGVTLRSRMETGRCMVWDCAKLLRRHPELKKLEGKDAQSILTSTVIRIVLSHVLEVTGLTPQAEVATVGAAYDFWRESTDAVFGESSELPVVILDTVEVLCELKFSRKHQDGRLYNVFEALSLTLPVDHAIIGIGCQAAVPTLTDVTATQANVTRIASPPMLDDTSTTAALAHWFPGLVVDKEFVPIWVELTGGLPRLLVAAGQPVPLNVGFMGGAPAVGIVQKLYQKFLRETKTDYPHTMADDALWWYTYSAFLASATKFPVVYESGLIPLPAIPNAPTAGMTWRKAAEWSIGVLSDGGFVVPPVFAATLVEAKAKEVGLPAPSKLQVFLDPTMLRFVGSTTSFRRGSLWEQTALYAIYARYLLLQWSTKSDWVALDQVLSCDDLKSYEVNLSGGVAERSKVSYDEASGQMSRMSRHVIFWNNGVSYAHHDAYLTARCTTNPSALYPMAVQLRHGRPKTQAELAPQLFKAKKKKDDDDPAPIDLPLLVVQNGDHAAKYSGLGLAQTVVGVDGTKFTRCEAIALVDPTIGADEDLGDDQ